MSSVVPVEVPSLIREHMPLMLQGRYHYIDGAEICLIPNASASEVDRAFVAAEAVRRSFGKTLLSVRVRLLNDLADILEKETPRMAAIESFDCGKPLREAEGDMNDGVDFLRHTATLVETELSKLQRVDRGSSGEFTLDVRWEGVGTIAAITPWNFPFLMALQKVGQGIATGCPVVLKPSEFASMTCVELAAMVHRLEGMPRGAFQLLLGQGGVTGQLMIDHPLPRKVSFTGSVATGQKVMRACADHMRGVHLELGGKSAMLVFEDVDVPAAVEWAVMGIYWGAGQVCSATSRLLIHSKVKAAFLQRLQQVVAAMKIGPGLQDGVQMGPLVAPQQWERVRGFIRRGIEAGVPLLFGGLEPVEGIDDAHKGGFFVRPTCFVDVPLSSPLWKEEIFGPVLCVRSFDTEEQAVQMANDSDFGLGAAVMTACPERADRVADELEAGSVWVNNSQPVVMGCGMPFGGWKKSGFGKEMGVEGLMEWMHAKAVVKAKHNYHMDLYTVNQ